MTTFSTQGLLLVSRGSFDCHSPRSWLLVCKLIAHIVKPDRFRVSLVSHPARCPYLMNVDSIISIIRPDRIRYALVVAHDMLNIHELLETIVEKGAP